jgi:hypothetical protein
VLERCSPDAVRGTTQLETIGEEIALTLGQTVMGEARQLDAEFAARSQLVSWLSDVRATFHGENLPEDAGSEPFFTLSAQEFQTRISDRDPITQFNLMKAYGRVWAHSPIRRARRQIDSKPELDAYSLSPDPDMLEDLAERYCDQSDMHSATLEWCLTNALLRNSVVKLAKQPMSLVPKLRAGAIEVSIQSTLAACAFLLAQSNVLIFWTVFLALNFLRWTSPSLSPALAKRSLKAGLLEQLLTTHDQLAIEDFNAAQVRDTLNGLQTRGAKLPAVLYRLLERRINRINRTNPITKT